MTEMGRYSAYDSFAWFYNKYWGARWVQQVMPVLEQLVLADIPSRAAVLDVCCGTGHVAQALTARGYRVTGIDGSDQMLKYARENAPESTFIPADAREFEIDGEYDVALSLYDSLNHVMELDGLKQVFRRVFQSLKPGGRFLFDVNTHEGYLANWKPERAFPIVADDHLLVVRTSYDADARWAKFLGTMFRLIEGEWVRSDLTLEQRCYSKEEILAALVEAGFREPYVSLDDETFPKLGQGRGFFRVAKPVE